MVSRLKPSTTHAKEQQSATTRQRIRDTARRLFNEQGSHHVTTHHIAAAAGLSAGNLYYHYSNKGEIVRDIFTHMPLFDGALWQSHGMSNHHGSFLGFLRFFFGELEKYRFFFREFPSLTRDDAQLSNLWRHHYQNLVTAMRQEAAHWVAEGILLPFADMTAMDAFIDMCWVVVNFTGDHLQGKRQGPQGKKAHAADVENLVIHFLYPYHTPLGRKALDSYRLGLP